MWVYRLKALFMIMRLVSENYDETDGKHWIVNLNYRLYIVASSALKWKFKTVTMKNLIRKKFFL